MFYSAQAPEKLYLETTSMICAYQTAPGAPIRYCVQNT